MKKKFLLAALITALTLTACGGGGGSYSAAESYAGNGAVAMKSASFAANDMAYDTYEEADYDNAPEVRNTDNEQPQADATQGRKLIRTVDLSLETKEFEPVYDDLTKKVAELGGWMEENTVSQNTYGSYDGSTTRDAYITARIPAKNLDEFLNYVDGNIKVTRKQENTSDVTMQYTDTEARIRSYEKEEQKLEEMIDAAQTVDELITIHDRLSTVQYQLDSARSSLNVLQGQIDCSSVRISLREVQEYTEPEPESFPVRVWKGFKENLHDTFDWLVSIVEWILTHLPSLAVFGIICFLFELLTRKSRKARAEKKAAEKEQKATKKAEKAAEKMAVSVGEVKE